MHEKETLKKTFLLVKPHFGRLGVAMVSMVAVAGLSAGQAYMVKPLLDEIFFNKDHLMLNLLPLALVLLFLVKGFFYYCYSYMMERVGHTIIMELRKRMLQHVQLLPAPFFSKTTTGELMSRITSDVILLQSAVSSTLVGVLKDFFQIIGLLGVIFFQDWKLALMSMIFLPMAVVPIVHFGRKYRKLSTKGQQTMADVSTVLHEAIGGNRIVKAFSKEEYEFNRFAAIVDKLFGITVRDIQLRSLAHPIMELLGGIGIALIIWYGGKQVLNGTATPGTFFSFLTALIMIYEPIKKVSSINNTLQQGIAAAIRVFSLLEHPTEPYSPPDAIAIPPIAKQIELKNVAFSYDGQTEVIQDLNLTVKAGEVLALVGPSGGGKTTLANLIPRFYEVSGGQILIDGHDIRQATLQSLRGQIGLVTQQTILFNDTVRNNIAYGEPDRPIDEVIAAAKAAHALEFIEALPQGFDTVIGESGSRLSGGQRQRISIARALLKNAPILILDEATSALDTESEREVQKALDNLMQGRTTFVIAHRLSTIKNANRIIVMQAGRIVEEGTHQSLLTKNGLYTTLHNMQ